MIDYIAAIDDSGGSEALIDTKGNVSKKVEAVALAAVCIRSQSLEAFEKRWDELRQKIAHNLDCNFLPEIHMCLMWGKKLPATIGENSDMPNPYKKRQRDFVQIKRWVDEAFFIIHQFNSQEQLFYYTLPQKRRDMQAKWRKFFSEPSHHAEVKFLEASNSKMCNTFYSILTNPMIELFTNLLPWLDESMKLSNELMTVQLDKMTGIRGVNSLEVVNAIKDSARLDSLYSFEIVSDYAQSPLTQAADVMAYTKRRFTAIEQKHIKVDHALAKIANKHGLKYKSYMEDVSGRVTEKLGEAPTKMAIVQYALARRAVVKSLFRRDTPGFHRAV